MFNTKDIYEMKKALYSAIYTDKLKIRFLIDNIEKLDLFNVYIGEGTNLVLKVKKTNIKKKFGINYHHTSNFYKDTLYGSFYNLFVKYREEINIELIKRNLFQEYNYDIFNIINNNEDIRLFYTCIPIMDNIVNLDL